MSKAKNQTSTLKSKTLFSKSYPRLVFLLAIVFTAAAVFFSIVENGASAQTVVQPVVIQPDPVASDAFRVGERITYNFSFETFENVAYAETYVASKGKLGDKDAVEIQSKFRTSDFLSAAFFLIDETRTTFVSNDTGVPLYVRQISRASGAPQEKSSNFLVAPTGNYDLLSLIYQVRKNGGIGSYNLQENGQIYNISFQNTGSERVRTDVADFETTISTVQSNFLTENGVLSMRVNFTQDGARLPVLIRFKTAKGEFSGKIASLQNLEQKTDVLPVITPTPTPIAVSTPKPSATPYIENQALLPELPFQLGETLKYQISENGFKIGTVEVSAAERKLIQNADTLFLNAKVTTVEANNQFLTLNDSITAQVDPATLAPRQIELKFSPKYAGFNQTAFFQQEVGTVVFNGARSAPIPVGTHSLLSLAYAIRSFNLKPSKDPKNPVNDTRVAVFLDDKAYVFILRPSDGDIINLQGEKVAAQQINIITGNPAIDRFNVRLWLGNGDARLPLRLAIGNYQADLIESKIIAPK